MKSVPPASAAELPPLPPEIVRAMDEYAKTYAFWKETDGEYGQAKFSVFADVRRRREEASARAALASPGSETT